MLRVLVISDSDLVSETVANEIGSLLESLKVGVEFHDVELQTSEEHELGLRYMRGGAGPRSVVISGMVV